MNFLATFALTETLAAAESIAVVPGTIASIAEGGIVAFMTANPIGVAAGTFLFGACLVGSAWIYFAGKDKQKELEKSKEFTDSNGRFLSKQEAFKGYIVVADRLSKMMEKALESMVSSSSEERPAFLEAFKYASNALQSLNEVKKQLDSN